MKDDYISRQAAIDAVTDELDMIDHVPQWVFDRLEKRLKQLPTADVVQVVRCKDCIHNNACYIQYSAQAGDNFFCGFGETEKDVREDYEAEEDND